MDAQSRFKKLHEMGYDIEKTEQPVIVKLEEALQKKKMTAMTLCKKTGISRQTMNAVLHGKMKPGTDFALKVAKVLQMSVEDLFSLHDSAWETLVTEESQSIYWDVAKEAMIEGKDVKKIEEENGTQYWSIESNGLISEAEYEKAVEKALVERMDEEVEKARKIPVGRREEKIFQRIAKDAILHDMEKRYLKRFQRVVKNIKPIA